MKAIKNVRLKDYNYAENGFYFVTVCADCRRSLFTDENKKILTHLVEQLPQNIKGVSLDYYQIMPSHIHLILILDNCAIKLGQIVRRLKAAATKLVGYKLWQPNYYEHVIRDEQSLNRIREYIQNNPLVEKL